MSYSARRFTNEMTATEKKLDEIFKAMTEEAKRLNTQKSNKLIKSILKDGYNYLD